MDALAFYGQKISSHRFLRDAIEVAEIIGDVDIVITGPPAGGDGSDVYQLDDDNLEDSTMMPEEDAGEVDVMYEESVDNITCEMLQKKQKICLPKWKQCHISSQPDLNKDKRESAKQLLLERSPDLAGASEWTLFEKAFHDMLEHLVCETNRYADR